MEGRISVDALVDTVAAHVDAIAAQRRLPDPVVAALRRAGVHRLLMPAALGGDEAPVTELVAVLERIAAVDGSAAWCTAIGAGTNILAGYMPEGAAKEVFADPDVGNASIFAPTGKVVRHPDGDRLDGRWRFSSNCLHSSWIALGAWVLGPDGQPGAPIPRLVFVPAGDVEVHDTWDAPGLRGTGSHDTSVSDLPIDLGRSCTFVDRPWPHGPLWRLPLFTVLVPVLAAVLLGVARGALDEVARQVRERSGKARGALGDDPVALADYAVAESQLAAAGAGLREALDGAWAVAVRGQHVDTVAQARVLTACQLVGDVAVDVACAAHRIGGGSAAYAASPLARRLADVQTGRQHIMFSHGHRPLFGRALAGLEAHEPPYLL